MLAPEEPKWLIVPNARPDHPRLGKHGREAAEKSEKNGNEIKQERGKGVLEASPLREI